VYKLVSEKIELSEREKWEKVGDEYLEFSEFENKAKRVIKEYLKIPSYKVSRELEMDICDIILKYSYEWISFSRKSYRDSND